MVRPQGRIFCRANFSDCREPIGTSSNVANKPRTVARAPAAAVRERHPPYSNADRLLTPYA